MKTIEIEIKLYKFNELSEEAKEKAIGEHKVFLDSIPFDFQFAIFFNGACVHTSKGIASINRKLSLLEDKFSTKFNIIKED